MEPFVKIRGLNIDNNVLYTITSMKVKIILMENGMISIIRQML